MPSPNQILGRATSETALLIQDHSGCYGIETIGKRRGSIVISVAQDGPGQVGSGQVGSGQNGPGQIGQSQVSTRLER